MNNPKVKAVYVVFFTFLFLVNIGTAKETATELSREELKIVGQVIKEVEESLRNVRIHSYSLFERGPSSSGPWEWTPVCLSSTAFLGNTSSNRVRLDIHKIVLEWKHGAAPYLEESYSVSFDGVQGRRKSISSSYNGKTFDRHRGSILPEPPIQLIAGSWYNKMIGIYASLFFHFRNLPAPFPKTFSPHFEAAADPNYYLLVMGFTDPNYLDVKSGLKFKVVHQELRGIQCIKMAYVQDSSLREWWLDPNRGFALLRHDNLREDKDGNMRVKSSINVTKLGKVAENIWWPMEAYFVQCPRGIDKPWERIFYRASKVVANDPNFDESVFNITFPEGYLVDDQVTGRKYTVGQE